MTTFGRTNTWDSHNRLVQCIGSTSTSTFLYGADGLRRQTSVTTNGTTQVRKDVLDNGMMVRELEGSGANAGNSVATYFQGASGPVYRRDDTQSTQPIAWYVYDGLGSVACELKPDGTVAGRRKVDAYGITRSTAGTGGKQGFVGQLGHTTDETGLIYMRARHYDPTTGRFISQDPAHQGGDWFSYCGGDPVNNLDPTGKYYGLSQFLTALGTEYFLVGMFFAKRGDMAGALIMSELAAVSFAIASLGMELGVAGNAALFAIGLSITGTGNIWKGLLATAMAGVEKGMNTPYAQAAIIAVCAYEVLLCGIMIGQDIEASINN